MGLIHCSELPRRKTGRSEGLNTHQSSIPVTVKVTAASGRLATKPFLSIIIPDARGNFLPRSLNGCQQPLFLLFRRILEAFSQRGGKQRNHSHTLDVKRNSPCVAEGLTGKECPAWQLVAAQELWGKFVTAQLQGVHCTLGPGLLGFLVLNRERLGSTQQLGRGMEKFTFIP